MNAPNPIDSLLANGDMQCIAGLATHVAWRDTGGGFASFGLLIEPVPAALAYGRTSRVFADLSMPEIVQETPLQHCADNPVFGAVFC